MPGTEKELAHLQGKVEVYEKQISSYNGKIDNIAKETKETNNKLSTLPCGEHQILIQGVKEDIDEIKENVVKKMNHVFYTLLCAITLTILMWGWGQVSKNDHKLIKKFVKQEITKLSYAADIYEGN